MSHALARKAIEAKLMAWASVRPIRVANFEEGFEAESGETYLRAFQLPASTTCRYLGGEAYEYSGVYQVSIICPAGQVMGTAEAIIDELSGLFRIDTPLSRNGFEGMVVEPVEQGPTITEPSVYTVPVSFTYLGQAEAP
ncbi:phage tail terminator-like protein [Pseudomonas sp. PS01300]|uniref:phage tail terminator-like protein n=1 Tax=Pseudomonas sp. PS01300 TaxID=2991436 RepID=UPI00249AFE95|nr:phage tail terminator-like protein [Pseudomonas sp. PS01300]